MESMDLMAACWKAGAVNVELRWSPGLEVRIHLESMDWGARSRCLAEVQRYVDSQPHLTAAAVRFSFPEPVDFTEAMVRAGERQPSTPTT